MLSLRLDPVRFAGVPVAKITAAIDPAANRHTRDGLVAASQVYLGFVRQRFLNAARGDGTWKPLAASTIRARLAKGAKSPRAKKMTRAQRVASLEILRDTGILFNSLSAGGASSVQRPIPWGIEVGTAVRYAKYHQHGGHVPGRPPQRTILVAPDAGTREQMRTILQAALIKASGEANG
jgi:hypothetical protein